MPLLRITSGARLQLSPPLTDQRQADVIQNERPVQVRLRVIWFWILITIIIDIFGSHDLSGWAKALWFVFILFLPLIGVLVYLIARGGKMHEHQVREAQLQEKQLRSYVQEAAGSQSSADQLAKLADLRDRGVITAEEFDREKAKILA